PKGANGRKPVGQSGKPAPQSKGASHGKGAPSAGQAPRNANGARANSKNGKSAPANRQGGKPAAKGAAGQRRQGRA
ncbi:MAG: hypothetical protein ACRCYJ_06065, partial [Plesiomonas shigelloides]